MERDFAQIVRLFETGRFVDAETAAREFLRRNPGNPYGNKVLGACLVAQKRPGDALPFLKEAARKLTRDAEVALNLGVAAWDLHDRGGASYQFRLAVELAPRDPDLRQAFARFLRDGGDLGGAAEQLHAGLSVKQDHAGCLIELGRVSQDAGAQEGARELFERVLAEMPSNAEVWHDLGSTLHQLKRYREAGVAFRRAYELGASSQSLLRATYDNLHSADWSRLASDIEILVDELVAGRVGGSFALLGLPGLPPDAVRNGVVALAESSCSGVKPLDEVSLQWEEGKRPLRIGYLSCDFHNHATSHLLVGVIEQHDRDRVWVFGYSHGPDDGSEMTRRIRGAFDVFRDVGSLDLQQTAQQIRDDEIDILVDLKGWTHDSRTRALAWRPAPIQVNWLGYPGTIGSRTLADYVIGDPWVTPVDHAAQYVETLAILPNCYQPNDDRRAVGPATTRSAVGLPEGAFVFCSFNQTYKINPGVADLWASVLRSAPDSVLWLLEHGEDVRENLQREFSARGVSADRLIFAPRVAAADHLSRLSLADLALDTFPYASHTTGSDALWVGVPMVTLPGDMFASRVGASLLAAVGLPELIAQSGDDFVRKALRLYEDRAYLRTVKSYLLGAGRRSPLFDTAGFTRDLENLFFAMAGGHEADDRSRVLADPAAGAPRTGATADVSDDGERSRILAGLEDAYREGRVAEVVEGARRYLESHPADARAQRVLGVALLKQEQWAEARTLLASAVAAAPGDELAVFNLGVVEFHRGRKDTARRHFERAVELAPANSKFRVSLAHALRELGRVGDAEHLLKAVLEGEPEQFDALKELAYLERDRGRVADALGLFQQLEGLKPDDPGVQVGLGTVLRHLKRYGAGADAFRHAYQATGETNSLVGAVHLELYAAKWDKLASAISTIRAALAAPRPPAVELFPLLSMPGVSRAELFRASEAKVAEFCGGIEPLPAPPAAVLPPSGRRLRVGYLSCDFHGHATALLLAGVIEHHDRSRVEVFGYSHGPEDDSTLCRRIRGAFDVFRDVTDLDMEQTARRIRDDGIDILVDLKGWTSASRTRVLAWRPAPIQVSWLGYPGTLGAPYLADYVIGDRWVTPVEHANDYSEKLALLPHSYQPNDDRRSVCAPISRSDAGLPEDAFVFCSLNQSYKINPAVADLWSEVLRAVPGSVLWLLLATDEVSDNIRCEFEARGVDPRRIFFAPWANWEFHAARTGVADVALDVFPYNSHTTGSDALWLGVPLVTLPGETFASRVGASLLTAVGLPELIADTPDAFVQIATSLAQERGRLERIKQYLRGEGRRSALYDSARFTRNLEGLFFEMCDRHRTGNSAPIEMVDPDPAVVGDPVPMSRSRQIERIRSWVRNGVWDVAAAAARELLAADPSAGEAHGLLGQALLALDDVPAALESLRAAVSSMPDDLETVQALAFAAWNAGCLDECRAQFERAVSLAPQDLQLRVNLARLLRQADDLGAAAEHLHAALAIDISHVPSLRELAQVTLAAGADDAARELFERVVAIDRHDAEAWFGLGAALRGLRRYGEAAAAFRAAHDLDSSPEALQNAIHADLYCANWRFLDREIPLLKSALAVDPAPVLHVFPLLSIPGLDGVSIRRATEALAAANCMGLQSLSRPGASTPNPGGRLRVGYLSCDFHAHATSSLVVGVMEQHDRTRMEVFAYSSGPDDGSDMCRRVRGAFDVFRDVSDLDIRQTAQQIQDDRIDILVDLKGWTHDSRTRVLAYRAAPIQVNWLGFPGTLGSSALADYIIGDAWVTPPQNAEQFCETLALLPASYQPNDRMRGNGSVLTRAAAGLPETGFVYCSFNQFYKINPQVADLWAAVLVAAPDAVLWLLDHGPEARNNLTREFEARGVASERLIFAPGVGWEDHVGRLALADAALDSFPYASHTTGSDALWAGVPIVTLPGDTFASRVGASLVAAVGLPELIADDERAFVRIATCLYSDRERLRSIKQYLLAEGRRSALFDTERFSRNLEALYFEMWRRRGTGDDRSMIVMD
ncbi:tetratricopeptide repeat protein [Azoarcus olearius]|uniref:O-linked N-acetylglucosamine transferase family protein n=1 Tax=Azoarcus sp. (strain BH72) TaxID=418699 RepID=UPI001470CD73|nr:tetratricopeptide repeat protein [Azoarcus olearius]